MSQTLKVSSELYSPESGTSVVEKWGLQSHGHDYVSIILLFFRDRSQLRL